MKDRRKLLAAAILVSLVSTIATAQTFSALRGSIPLDQSGPAPPITPERNTALREARNYPEQPPVIPHAIEGYEVSIRGNKCLSSKEVWGKIFGVVDTREKFLDHRLELAIREWARMKANDSLECRNCHSAESMDITRQGPRAVAAHQRFLFAGEKTCIDCHKGIAHHLPDMRSVPGWQ